jgi:hypothetical protein
MIATTTLSLPLPSFGSGFIWKLGNDFFIESTPLSLSMPSRHVTVIRNRGDAPKKVTLMQKIQEGQGGKPTLVTHRGMRGGVVREIRKEIMVFQQIVAFTLPEDTIIISFQRGTTSFKIDISISFEDTYELKTSSFNTLALLPQLLERSSHFLEFQTKGLVLDEGFFMQRQPNTLEQVINYRGGSGGKAVIINFTSLFTNRSAIDMITQFVLYQKKRQNKQSCFEWHFKHAKYAHGVFTEE